MSKEKRSPSDGFKKGGYQPLNEGYTPTEKRGYIPGGQGQGSGLPKAPVGGTGQTQSQTQNKPTGTTGKK